MAAIPLAAVRNIEILLRLLSVALAQQQLCQLTGFPVVPRAGAALYDVVFK